MHYTIVSICLAVLLVGCAANPYPTGIRGGKQDQIDVINHTLDSFHAAAARADFDGYFGLFTENGVFLGTDASERWTVEEFKAYCKPYFEQGKGWTYVPRERFVEMVNAQDCAWVDEVLDNEKYGLCRGTALMRRDPRTRDWKIARYSLAFLIPNEVAEQATGLDKK